MITERAPPSLLLLAAALMCCPLLPALAAEPLSLQELLSKAQSEAETKAVNDLIDKLKGVARPKAPGNAASAPQSSSAGAEDKAASVPSATPEPPSPAERASGERLASPAPVAAPAVSPPEAAIEAAAHKKLPSVDLELYFAYNSDAISREALPDLRTLGEALKDQSLVEDAFLIAGHTDAKGGARFNLDLSRRRAEAVKQFLIVNFGIDEKRLLAKGFGFTHLKNSREPLAAENRRVQIVNLSKDR